MPSMLSEALEWLDRAEQAREVAGQLPIPARENRSWTLPKVSIASPEPPRHPRCSGEENWRRSTKKKLDGFSVFLDGSVGADLPGFPVHESSIGMLNYFA